MRQSQLVELPWNEHQPIGNLTEIDLSYCESLIQIPNLCAATNLQRINFRGCKSLVQVPSSFKNLDKLECLDLGLCDNLKDGLENLPLNIRVLFLARTAIEALPSSFSCLMKLEYLNLSECENMTNGIENLPSNLQTLTLSGCIKLEDIQNIPSSIGITELELDFIGIETLPESIWKMRCLKQLRLHDCPYLEMLQEISDDCMSSSLEKLDIYSCPSLKSISASIWKKSNLKHLTIEYCPDLEKLQEVSDDYMSSSLEVLEIRDCAILKSIPESIWKIRCLKDLTLKDCPNLENLQEISDDCMSSGLEELYISGCTRLKLNPMQNLCVAIKLQKIDLVGCTSLVQVPPWFKNLQKLSHLGLVCCENLKDGLENLPLNILWLSLYGTAIEALPSSFRDLETLLYLTLTDCKNLTDGIENLPMNLRTLYLSGCEKLKSIPVLPSRLNYLDASNCASLDASICLSLGTMSSWWDLQQVDDDFERCQAVYPGNEIPFRHQTDGNAFSILFPANWFLIHDPLCGFLISIVFTVNGSLPHIDFNIDLYDADRLHYRVWKSYALETDGNMIAYRCETDHVFIGKAILNLKDVFGEEWTSVCSNIIDVSFRVSIEGDRVIPCIKKVGLKMWGTASKNKRGYSECSDQTIGNQDESHDPHINSKRIKAQSNN